MPTPVPYRTSPRLVPALVLAAGTVIDAYDGSQRWRIIARTITADAMIRFVVIPVNGPEVRRTMEFPIPQELLSRTTDEEIIGRAAFDPGMGENSAMRREATRRILATHRGAGAAIRGVHVPAVTP